MVERAKVIALFPGQGAFDGAALAAAYREYPQIKRVFEEIDTVSREFFSRDLSKVLFGDVTPEMEKLLADDAWVSQLAIYGSSLAAWQILADSGAEADVLVGHSLGEIAALVAAQAFSVADGARIVAHRVQVIERQGLAPGRMAALSADGDRVRALIALIGDELLSVATENHDTQTVVSGPRDAMEKALAVSKQLGISTADINSPFPFHTPILAPAAPVFAGLVGKLDQRPLRTPVYSPVLGRYYEPDDALGELLAEHFVKPVRFSAAVRHLHGEGRELRFVEVGGKAVLTKLVGKVLGSGARPATWSTLSLGGDGKLGLAGALADLGTPAKLDDGKAKALAAVFAPDASAAEFAEFWAAFGGQLVGLGKERLAEFRALRAEGTGQAAPPAAAGTGPKAVVERGAVADAIRSIYAAALEYPEEVFTEDVLLEAELGVDSVKQVELLTRVSEHYGLPPRDTGFRLVEIDTMAKVVDFFVANLGDGAAELDVPQEKTATELPAEQAAVERGAVADAIRSIYAAALEYPEEVFTEDVLLEAELGVDSVKQVELLTRVSEHYGLPPRDTGFRLVEIDTMAKVVDFFVTNLESGAVPVAA
ncbi:acyltransferase domain-containing protein [Streptomyces sp. HU2014]|uniref:acyltransferase domain-containing protein n=1 Tax=Streptomyces sp. HU2014 TaxID=2939414 RepID=UPI00200FA754|nr:acyltransferase domain-containing protein [Streptomyces sp. HU2014]UQI43347.1 acyltransferase domain-containing protein [Streptomyces sp. HU2014]